MTSRVLIFFSCLFVFTHCRKPYECDCRSTWQGHSNVNPEHYTLKSKDPEAAANECLEEYKASGKAVGSVTCHVK